MVIQFFSDFAKKYNSTKRPVGAVDRSLTGHLKQPCSIMKPIINIERLPQDANPCVYTYAIIPAFQRFYFVEDWVWNDGLWEVHMSEDVLGTWKTQIGASTEYVLRTDSITDYNGEITDTTYPATTDFTIRSQISSGPFPTTISVGCYVVGIISGNSASAVGAISYYAMTSYQFGVLNSALLSDTNLITMGLAILDPSTGEMQPTITDMSLELLKTMYNPFQYIVSCMWFPFPVDTIPDTDPVTTGIKIGWWEYPSVSGNLMYAQTANFAEHMQLTTHPQATRGTYMNYAPYTRRTLIGRFGTVALDGAYFNSNYNSVGVEYVVDLITGQCKAGIERLQPHGQGFDSDIIAQREFLLGVPIQLAQVGVDYLGTAVSAINTIPQVMGGAISGIASGQGAITGAIACGASGIYNTLQTAMPQVETSGHNGSFLAPANETRLVEQFFEVVDEDLEHRGRPLCEMRRLDTLDGFILCAEGEIDISCFDDERKTIMQHLTTGFFWE